LLHLCGADRTAAVVPDGVTVARRIVYAARLRPLGEPGEVEVVLLFSARSAAHFASEWARLGRARDVLDVVAISDTAAAAAGTGWRQMVIAARPDQASLLAALAGLGI
jgi:uroporphyrinogen-III synthase